MPLSPPVPSRDAAWQLIDAIDLAAYATTRNALDGAVTRLSPYLTHGLVSLPEVIARLSARQPLAMTDKLLFQFGWREFFRHVWQREGDRILTDLRPAATGLSPAHYQATMPEDILAGRTGVPAIDAAVRQLYRDGYLHNHARLWLASYLVHYRKVDWRVGADWLVGHLLDGDLASNHLSWQWVAGTFSQKPYLFNAENVARFAGANHRHWHSAGTAIDCSYEALEALARSSRAIGPEPGEQASVTPPALLANPPQATAQADLARLVAGRSVLLVHPWSLGASSDCDLSIGVVHQPFHRRWHWSAKRWEFVWSAMRARCASIVVTDLQLLQNPLRQARRVDCVATLNPGYAEALAALVPQARPEPQLFSVERQCQSFSRFYSEARRLHDADAGRSIERWH